ncbi:MAG TPA: PDZ domain-containing protein [Bryobacteraceae bacterium]|nr:PDZ domain-containing protein [Bryobacteraceae bacterium]
MQTKIMISGMCLGAFLASAVSAEPPERVRAPSHQIVAQHGGSSYLGVGWVEITPERAKELHLKDERGVEVRCVDPDSPAAKAGLKEGDVVLEYNSQRVEGGEQFLRLVRETPPGRTAGLLIFRNGANQTLTTTIGQRQNAVLAMGWETGEPLMAVPPLPPMPPMPGIRIPDIPRAFTTWRSPTLGIESESLNPQLAEYFGVKEGVLVRAVTHDSAAEKAGFKAGDVIVKVEGQTVTTPKEISSILQSSRSKKTMIITVVRRQKEVVLNVTLEERSSWNPLDERELL